MCIKQRQRRRFTNETEQKEKLELDRRQSKQRVCRVLRVFLDCCRFHVSHSNDLQFLCSARFKRTIAKTNINKAMSTTSSSESSTSSYISIYSRYPYVWTQKYILWFKAANVAVLTLPLTALKCR